MPFKISDCTSGRDSLIFLLEPSRTLVCGRATFSVLKFLPFTLSPRTLTRPTRNPIPSPHLTLPCLSTSPPGPCSLFPRRRDLSASTEIGHPKSPRPVFSSSLLHLPQAQKFTLNVRHLAYSNSASRFKLKPASSAPLLLGFRLRDVTNFCGRCVRAADWLQASLAARSTRSCLTCHRGNAEAASWRRWAEGGGQAAAAGRQTPGIFCKPHRGHGPGSWVQVWVRRVRAGLGHALLGGEGSLLGMDYWFWVFIFSCSLFKVMRPPWHRSCDLSYKGLFLPHPLHVDKTAHHLMNWVQDFWVWEPRLHCSEPQA